MKQSINRIGLLILGFLLIVSCTSVPDQEAEVLSPGQRIDITDLDTVDLVPGQEINYSYEDWTSVGIGADYSIKDSSVLTFVKEESDEENRDIDYNDEEEFGMTGNDQSYESFLFRALKEGGTVLTIRHLFRGDVEKTRQIQVNVR